MLIKKTILITLIVLLIPVLCWSQDAEVYRIYLSDGSVIIGELIEETELEIKVQTASGLEMTIQRETIREMKKLAGEIRDGEFHRIDPNHTRMFFAPTARPLGHGEGYFALYEIFFPFLAFGIGDFLTLAGGITLIPGAPEQIYYLAPKITALNTGDFSLAGGVFHLGITGYDDFDGFGILYTNATYGTKSASITGGLGWGYYGSETTEKPVLLLGGDVQITNSLKLMNENWIFPEDVAMLIFGVRFFGDKFASDLGLVFPTSADMDGLPFFPWLNVVYNFGG